MSHVVPHGRSMSMEVGPAIVVSVVASSTVRMRRSHVVPNRRTVAASICTALVISVVSGVH